MDKTFNSKAKKTTHPNPKLQHLISKENRHSQRVYNPKYQFVKYRSEVIPKLLLKVCNKFGLSNETFYLAIHLFDAVSSRVLIKQNTLIYFVMACLGLASKVKESRAKALQTSDLNRISRDPRHDFGQTEKQILELLAFDVDVVTPYDFLEELLRRRPTCQDVGFFTKKVCAKMIQKMGFITTLSYEANQFSSLAVSLSVVVIFRKIAKCGVLFPESLQDITGLTESDLEPCVKKILGILKKAGFRVKK